MGIFLPVRRRALPAISSSSRSHVSVASVRQGRASPLFLRARHILRRAGLLFWFAALWQPCASNHSPPAKEWQRSAGDLRLLTPHWEDRANKLLPFACHRQSRASYLFAWKQCFPMGKETWGKEKATCRCEPVCGSSGMISLHDKISPGSTAASVR